MSDATPAPDTNVVPLRAAAPPAESPEQAIMQMTNRYAAVCLDCAAIRVEWLAAGLSCWPDSLVTREHLLAQLKTLAESIRGIKVPPRPERPTGGAA